MTVILQVNSGIYTVYHFIYFNNLRNIQYFNILEKEEAAEKGYVEIEDRGTSAHLYWGFCFFYCFLVIENSLLFFYSIFLSMCLEEGGVLEVFFQGRDKWPWGRNGCLGWGLEVGGTIQIKYEMNFIVFLKRLLFHSYFSVIFLEW